MHGLHYIGDKLDLISRAVSWLVPQGIFAASLGLENFRFDDGRPAGRQVASALRQHGLDYDSRKRLLTCRGARRIRFPFRYVGANDQAGPNYTGQPAVDSCYVAAASSPP